MRMILVLMALFFCSDTFAQIHRDSLQLAVDSLNKSMECEISGFEESNSDFLVLRVNDSLSDWYNSYHCIYELDSCSVSYVIMIIINTIDELTQAYEIRVSKIYKDIRVPPGKKICFNELDEIGKYLKNEYLNKSTRQNPANWELYPYVLYGKVNGDYIFETFDNSFISTFHSGMVYEVVCNKFGLYCPKN